MEPKYFVLCYADGPSVRIAYARSVAESEMEAPDIEDWKVFDDEGFERELAKESPGGVVLIGRRTGEAPATKEIRDTLQRYLGRSDTDEMSMARLIELAVVKNQDEDDGRRRRGRKIGGVVFLAAMIYLAIKWLR